MAMDASLAMELTKEELKTVIQSIECFIDPKKPRWAKDEAEDVDIILLLTGGGPIDKTTTLPVFVFYEAFTTFRMGKASAAAMLMLSILLVLLIAYLWMMKKIEKKS